MRRILLCQPRGFCAGVDRAIDTVEHLLKAVDEPIYVRKEIVHNRAVVEDLTQRGVTFVDDVQEAPEGSLLVFSAHGVSPAVREAAARRGQRTVDATCPLVTKVHREVQRFTQLGRCVILIGHAGHEEVDGILGEAPGVKLVQNVADASLVCVDDPARVGVVTQTTLNVSEIEEILAVLIRRFPMLERPPKADTCYATENRQAAVRRVAANVDAVLVVGSPNSSNSRSLRAIAGERVPAYLIDDPKDLRREWLVDVATLGITAGASSPETLVKSIVRAVVQLEPAFGHVEMIGDPEPVMRFAPPAMDAL